MRNTPESMINGDFYEALGIVLNKIKILLEALCVENIDITNSFYTEYSIYNS